MFIQIVKPDQEVNVFMLKRGDGDGAWLACADADLDVPSTFPGRAVQVCAVPSLPCLNWACWHSRQFLTAIAQTEEGWGRETHSMVTCNYSNSQRNILKKNRETKAKGWSEAAARSAPWPAVAASFTLPCSTSPPKVAVCGCALESNPEWSSHNKWHC